jgi:TolB-like protein
MFVEVQPNDPAATRRAAFIAVTPFRRVGLEPDAARVGASFLEDVTLELARWPGIEVLAGRTSFALAEADLEPRRMHEAYGVTHLVDGSLRAADEGLQVGADLVEASSGRVLWSRRFHLPARPSPAAQEDLAAQLANQVCGRLNLGRLAQVRSRPVSSLEAYDCWLRGHERLRRSTPEDDEAARSLFERALSIDPTYARAYAGLSLSHFKRWNWRRATPREEADDRLSLDYARRAEELDDLDPVVQLVLGRTHVYRHEFAQGRARLERALELSPNVADLLMQAAPLWAYLGEPERAAEMAAKAFRLNPLHDPWYPLTAFVPQFCAGRLEAGLELLDRAPPNIVFEQHALAAATLALLGREEEARAHVPKFLEEFRAAINGGLEPNPAEAVRQMLDSNPFCRAEDVERMVEGLRRAGVSAEARAASPVAPAAELARFVRAGELWEAAYAGKSVHLPDMKGCRDLALLLAAPDERIHCMDLAGRAAEGDAGAAMDVRARAACQRRIRDLQEAIAEAERDGDLARTERLGEELDALIEQLSAAIGLGGRRRKLGDPAEKARTAVTWRIRNAVKRIAEAHPALGRHLELSVRTGAFCAYAPEHAVRWST